MLGVACLLVLAPLLGLRDLGRLGPMSTAGVAIAGGFAAAVVAVTGIAFAKGEVGGELTGKVLWKPPVLPMCLARRLHLCSARSVHAPRLTRSLACPASRLPACPPCL